MKISLNWLKDYVEFKKDLSIVEMRWQITEATAEVEGVQDLAQDLDKVVIGKVKTLEKHPDADKLKVAQVDVGSEVLQIVCGGVNLAEGMSVAVSLPGAMVRWHGEGEPVEVKKAKLRGVESIGMICASSEIGLESFFPNEGEKDISDFSEYDAKPGQAVAEVLGLNDHVFEIDNHSITHRPDLFSHYGFARECVALGLAAWKKQLELKDPSDLAGKTALPVKPHFADKDCSKNYYATVIRGVSAKQSPAWVKARLAAVGIRSINAIVDATNLVMMEIGQPNHAFDLRLIEGKDFTHRLSKQGEKVTTLDGVERELDEGIIIVESGKEIIDLCGVMGGENSAIKDDTTDLYLHVCHYDNVRVRKAMISLGHRTDAGTIFEKSIEPERAALGFARALEVFKELFPEAIMENEVYHYQEASSAERTIRVPFEKVSSLIGLNIDQKDAKQYLEDLGFGVEFKEEAYVVTVPSWRANGVSIPEDIIEEIIRIHGLSKIPNTPPYVELATPVKNHKRHTKRTLQKLLTGAGYQEEVNFSFLSDELLQKANINDFSHLIEIANPVNEDFRYMRPNFLSYLLSNLSRNQIQDNRVWKSFEMGAVYQRVDQEIAEEHLLTCCLSAPEKSSTFAAVRALAESLMKELALPVEIVTGDHAFAYPGHCVALADQGEVIGHVFDVHPLLMENFKLKGSVSLLEINLDKLYQITPVDVLYQQINRQPKALLDINVVVNEDTMVSEVEDIIASVENHYLSEATLMDVYQGENLGKGKKSFTFALAYQHPERTLEEQEIQNILESLIKKLEAAGGTVRR